VTFLFTLKAFFKTLLFPLMAIGLFYASISILNYISLLFVFSLPLAVYLFLIKKDTEELEELVKEKEIEIII
jgi:Ca2+/Na+ antiporter